MHRYLLVAVLCISSCAITSCVEASYTLASESRLPKRVPLPPGLIRKDVSVTLNLYRPRLRGPDAKFILKDRKGKTLAVVSANATVLLQGIDLVPCRELANMDQNGRAGALFCVVQ